MAQDRTPEMDALAAMPLDQRIAEQKRVRKMLEDKGATQEQILEYLNTGRVPSEFDLRGGLPTSLPDLTDLVLRQRMDEERRRQSGALGRSGTFLTGSKIRSTVGQSRKLREKRGTLLGGATNVSLLGDSG